MIERGRRARPSHETPRALSSQWGQSCTRRRMPIGRRKVVRAPDTDWGLVRCGMHLLAHGSELPFERPSVPCDYSEQLPELAEVMPSTR